MQSLRTTFVIVCAASGAAWGMITVSGVVPGVRFRPVMPMIVSGMLTGVAIRFISLWFYFQKKWIPAPWSLARLYMAVAMTAIVLGIYVVLNPSGPIQPPRGPFVIIAEGLAMFLWAFTKGFYFIAVWPLAFLNHLLLRKFVQHD